MSQIETVSFRQSGDDYNFIRSILLISVYTSVGLSPKSGGWKWIFAFRLVSTLLSLIFIAVFIITEIGKTCGDELIGSQPGVLRTWSGFVMYVCHRFTSMLWISRWVYIVNINASSIHHSISQNFRRFYLL